MRFCLALFVAHANQDLLRAYGAELTLFSPLEDVIYDNRWPADAEPTPY